MTPIQGDTETRGHGDTETRRHGDTETRGQGDTETRGHGDEGTRGHGDTETRGHGDTETRGHGDTETRGHGEKENPFRVSTSRVYHVPASRVVLSPRLDRRRPPVIRGRGVQPAGGARDRGGRHGWRRAGGRNRGAAPGAGPGADGPRHAGLRRPGRDPPHQGPTTRDADRGSDDLGGRRRPVRSHQERRVRLPAQGHPPRRPSSRRSTDWSRASPVLARPGRAAAPRDSRGSPRREGNAETRERGD